MRIVYDVSPLSHPRTGVGNYVRGALRGLAEAAGETHEIVAFAPASGEGRRLINASLDGVPVERRLPVLPFAHALRTGWSRVGRPSAEHWLGRFDVLHFSDWMYPPQRGGVRATTIHDLVPLRFPHWTTRRTRSMHRRKYAHAARSCDLIVANSQFTAADVVELLGVPRERVRVAYPGVDRRFRPDGDRAELGQPYVLTVATLEPRKNLATLFAAHARVRDEVMLVVAGAEGWGPKAPPPADDVRLLGFVSDAELPRLYRGAAAFVFPSHFEGFGLPVIEAMASGVPCVVSSHPSLDEASGDAAVRADPDDAEALAAGITRALQDRAALVPKGLEHGRRFTWQATGRALLSAYEDAGG